LTNVKGIDRVRTMFVLSTLKRETAVPLNAFEIDAGTQANNSKGNNKNG